MMSTVNEEWQQATALGMKHLVVLSPSREHLGFEIIVFKHLDRGFSESLTSIVLQGHEFGAGRALWYFLRRSKDASPNLTEFDLSGSGGAGLVQTLALAIKARYKERMGRTIGNIEFYLEMRDLVRPEHGNKSPFSGARNILMEAGNGISIIIHADYNPGENALSLAVKRQEPHTVAMLLAFTFPSGEEEVGFTVQDEHVFTAVSQGATEMVKLLLKAHGEVNATDEEGVTPLLLAAEKGDSGMVNLLRERGARTDSLRNDGAGLVAIVIRHGHHNLADLAQQQVGFGQQQKSKDALEYARTLSAAFLTPPFLSR